MSEHQKTTQATISGTQNSLKEHQTVEQFELFVPKGNGDHVNLLAVINNFEQRISDLEGA